MDEIKLPLEGMVELCTAADYPHRVADLMDNGWAPLCGGERPNAVAGMVIPGDLGAAYVELRTGRSRDESNDVIAVAHRGRDTTWYQVLALSDAHVLYTHEDGLRNALCIERETLFRDLVCRPLPWDADRYTWYFRRAAHEKLRTSAAMAGAEQFLLETAWDWIGAGLFAGQAMQLRSLLQRFDSKAVRRMRDVLERVAFEPRCSRVRPRNSRDSERLFSRLLPLWSISDIEDSTYDIEQAA